MSKKALVLLGAGAEGLEVVISIDVLRRAEIEVTVAGIRDLAVVESSRGIKILPDVPLSKARKNGPYDAIVMPGGYGGTDEMVNSEEVGELLKEQEKSGAIIAAICAAPTALKAHGIYLGKSLTSYPEFEEVLSEQYIYKQDPVVVDDNLITSRAPGTAFQFAFTIVEKLVGKEKAQEVAKAWLYEY